MTRGSYVRSRVQFYEDTKSGIKFSNFTLVDTPVGPCVEFGGFKVGLEKIIQTPSTDDTFSRIDRLEAFDSKTPFGLVGVHGFNCYPIPN